MKTVMLFLVLCILFSIPVYYISQLDADRKLQDGRTSQYGMGCILVHRDSVGPSVYRCESGEALCFSTIRGISCTFKRIIRE